MPDIIQVNSKNFKIEVLDADTKVLVYFWAPWCGPCKVMTPNVEQFAASANPIKVVKINVDENQGLAQQYSVMSVPTLLVFNKRDVMKQSTGVLSPHKIQALIQG